MREYLRLPSVGLTLGISFVAIAIALTLVAGAKPDINQKCTSSGYLSARMDLKRAQAAMEKRGVEAANKFAVSGLAELDEGYYKLRPQEAILDDTGQHLSLAYYQELHGDQTSAARERISVLQDRIELFRSSRHCSN